MWESLMITVFVVGYLLITLEQKVGVNKTATALLTAVLCWVLLVIREAQAPSGQAHGLLEEFNQHWQGTAQIVLFLIGAMTIVEIMESHGAFRVVAKLIKTTDKRSLLWVGSYITFFLSAVLDNLTTAIVMITFFHRLVHDREDRLVFGSMVIIAANAGGAWTPIGDVTTTMLWIGGRVSSLRLIEMLFVPSLVAMLVPLTYFTLRMSKGPLAVAPASAEEKNYGAKRVFFLGLAALMFVPVFKVLTGLPPVVGMFFGLGILWVVTDLMHAMKREHLRVHKVLARIDFTSALFFLGILLAISALEIAGILGQWAARMDLFFGNKDIVVTVIGLVSAVIDNVPLTAATMGMYDLSSYPMDAKLWQMLAFAVGTGGSILIIGSAAGVVVMGLEKMSFFWYVRRVTLPALLGYLAGIAAFLAIHP